MGYQLKITRLDKKQHLATFKGDIYQNNNWRDISQYIFSILLDFTFLSEEKKRLK